MGRSRLPPASTRCAVTSGMRGACLEAMRSAIRRLTACILPSRCAASLSCGLPAISFKPSHSRAASRQMRKDGHIRFMKQLLRTTDPTELAFAQALLQGEGIAVFEMDVNMSVLEGSIGILPRRLMVADRDYADAMRTLRDNGLDPVDE